MHRTYEDAAKISKEYKEDCDCSVRAITVACDVDYEESHQALKQSGRLNRNGVDIKTMIKALIFELGCNFNIVDMVSLQSELGHMLSVKDVKKVFPNGQYLIGTYEHVSALVEGEFIDWSIPSYWRVEWVISIDSVEGKVAIKHNKNELEYGIRLLNKHKHESANKILLPLVGQWIEQSAKWYKKTLEMKTSRGVGKPDPWWSEECDLSSKAGDNLRIHWMLHKDWP